MPEYIGFFFFFVCVVFLVTLATKITTRSIPEGYKLYQFTDLRSESVFVCNDFPSLSVYKRNHAVVSSRIPTHMAVHSRRYQKKQKLFITLVNSVCLNTINF